MACAVDLQLLALGELAESITVVSVLVGEEDTIELLGMEAKLLESLADAEAGDACIDHECCALRADDGGVAFAAAS